MEERQRQRQRERNREREKTGRQRRKGREGEKKKKTKTERHLVCVSLLHKMTFKKQPKSVQLLRSFVFQPAAP